MKVALFLACVMLGLLMVNPNVAEERDLREEQETHNANNIWLRSKRSACADAYTNCIYLRSRGYCSLHHYKTSYCKKTCGSCATTNSATKPVSAKCQDGHANCKYWSSRGECNKNRKYMLTHCKKSCRVCGSKKTNKPVCRDQVNYCNGYYKYCKTKKYQKWIRRMCARTCGYCPARCQDGHASCKYWSSRGECNKNRKYMLTYCKKSCRVCGVTTTRKPASKKTTSTRTPRKTTTTPTPKKTTTTPKPRKTCGMPSASLGRIVGGRFAQQGAWPWHAAITSCKNCSVLPFCGGTLVGSAWVVTASHCVQNWLAEELYVVLGDTHLHQKAGHEITVGVDKIYVHNDYGLVAPYDNDVALLRLKKAVTYSRYVKPACLANSHPQLPAGTICTVTGFGRTSETGYKTPRLMQADVPLKSTAECRELMKPKPITSNMLCAGYAKGRIDACRGDSGGPLVCRRADGSWELTGIVSWGVGCARENRYGVYADVRVLRAWIEDKMSNYVPGKSG